MDCHIIHHLVTYNSFLEPYWGILDLGRFWFFAAHGPYCHDLGQCSPVRPSRSATAEVNIYFRLREHFHCKVVYHILFPNREETSSQVLLMKAIRFLGIRNVNYVRFSENACHVDIRFFCNQFLA